MGDRESTIEGISVEALQTLLRKETGDQTATITAFSSAPMQHQGNGGNQFLEARIIWTGIAGGASASWVLKHWRPGGFAGEFMGVSRPLEALAWEYGLLRPATLPDGMIIPYVGTTPDESGSSAWIVMEDVSGAFDKVRQGGSTADKIEQARLVLDRLARWHVAWEQTDRQAILRKHSWLVGQGTRLRCGADVYAICLGQAPPRMTEAYTLMCEAICPPTHSFLSRLAEADRHLWEELLHRRDILIEGSADLPQTLIHGDLHFGNLGLRCENDLAEVLLIDWEWVGRGSPAFDVRPLIENAVQFCHAKDLGRKLSDFYFDCYVSYGGSLMDRPTWERAYDLATILEGLRVFPFIAGGSPESDSMFYAWLDDEFIRDKTEDVTQAMWRWVG